VSSQALDLCTIAHALGILSTHINDEPWNSTNDTQKLFLAWYDAHRDEVAQLDGLNAVASRSYDALNAFLQEHGFKPQFQPFDGVGVASILDMLVEWLKAGTPVIVDRFEPKQHFEYPGFSLSHGVTCHDLPDATEPLVQVQTKTGHNLWLMTVPTAPDSGMELALKAVHLLDAPRSPSTRWVGMHLPVLEMELEPDLNWLLDCNNGEWAITQAFQQFRLRVNQTGARVKVATGVVAKRGLAMGPRPYIFARPFMGWFTAPGHGNLPLAAFWADYDSWRQPEGTLEGM